MNSIQVADQTFIAADPVDIGRVISNSTDWRRWWPDLQLNVVEERAEKGIRWTVAGPLTGTMEVWLQPVLDGAIVHYFLHAEPSGASAAQVAKLNLAKLNHARRIVGKRFAFGIKQQLEATRPIGESRVPSA
ncbi:polyketide cyclase / dehydrase and lipid transport [Mycobacterium sp. CBMA271]|uniref:polyketide cyclase / dehydrase and lipid transport n=1 Tax=unclassified Mycobacteroides TaxID=2618759 RepID=UPI0012DF95E7|nr:MULTISPECIES: polyketide cyclase / dehydrase and lipid transport [unclassified Mycobacteroides]MUM18634.1 polyketide cyclase / dehydrase and lipid transport [Mycobacteroides sp. CBMA 326]MUM22596.1 polyketide cyclase / dehydrase and lipid transport [Mycobacteroides sp. CBMA 271]